MEGSTSRSLSAAHDILSTQPDERQPTHSHSASQTDVSRPPNTSTADGQTQTSHPPPPPKPNQISSKDTRFPDTLATSLINARRAWRPFWGVIATLLIILDIVISLSVIVLSAIIATFSDSTAGVIRGLAITTTVLAGIAALMKGTVCDPFSTLVHHLD